MATIITRDLGTTAKGSPLTNAEVDANFINLNTQLEAVDSAIEPLASDIALVLSIALG